MNPKYAHIPRPPVPGREELFIELVEEHRDLGLERMRDIIESMLEVDQPGITKMREEIIAGVARNRKRRKK